MRFLDCGSLIFLCETQRHHRKEGYRTMIGCPKIELTNVHESDVRYLHDSLHLLQILFNRRKF